MNMAFVIVLVVVALFFVLKGKGNKSTPIVSNQSDGGWIICPVVNGKNYSEGMPARPVLQGAGWYFDFPQSGGVDYVQNKNPPSLVGAKQIALRYAVTGAGFTAADENAPGRVGLHLQRKGDDWSGQGKFQQYRWYSHQRPVLVAGEFVLTVPLELSAWGDVYGKNDDADAFAAALKETACIAVVFGGEAAGHGVYATQPSRFALLELVIR